MDALGSGVVSSPTLQRCPMCGGPWPEGREFDLRSLNWLDHLPRDITSSNFDTAFHDGFHGRDRFLLFETKGKDEKLLKGQEWLLRAAAGLPRWDVFVLRGTVDDLMLERVTSTEIKPGVPTTTAAVRAPTLPISRAGLRQHRGPTRS